MEAEANVLWNGKAQRNDYTGEHQAYQQAILEQYKLYVEMADRISARRSLTNNFFLGLNTAIVSAATALLNSHRVSPGWVFLPVVALLVGCGSWFLLVRSYRLLNSKKYRIIGRLEERLPALPWSYEWVDMDNQKGLLRHWRLTLIEQWVPWIFALIYLLGYIGYIFS